MAQDRRREEALMSLLARGGAHVSFPVAGLYPDAVIYPEAGLYPEARLCPEARFKQNASKLERAHKQPQRSIQFSNNFVPPEKTV